MLWWSAARPVDQRPVSANPNRIKTETASVHTTITRLYRYTKEHEFYIIIIGYESMAIVCCRLQLLCRHARVRINTKPAWIVCWFGWRLFFCLYLLFILHSAKTENWFGDNNHTQSSATRTKPKPIVAGERARRAHWTQSIDWRHTYLWLANEQVLASRFIRSQPLVRS